MNQEMFELINAMTFTESKIVMTLSFIAYPDIFDLTNMGGNVKCVKYINNIAERVLSRLNARYVKELKNIIKKIGT